MNERRARSRPPPIDGIVRDSEPSRDNNLDEIFRERQRADQINPDDTVHLADLGSGTSGFVTKVKHLPSNTILARKVINMETLNQEEGKRILRELDVLQGCKSEYIVNYLSAFYRRGEINLFMEYMDGNSLEVMLKKTSHFPEDPVLGEVTNSVLKGLNYLRRELNIMHRDIKPSNILVNSQGKIKICDFGVSGQLINSMAQSFIGTRYYMAPERLSATVYNVKSDIWSFGLTLVELALGKYPIPQDNAKEMYEGVASSSNAQISFFELLEYVVRYPPPTVPEEYFSPEFKDLVDKSLEKEPNQRIDLRAALQHPFTLKYHIEETDVEKKRTRETQIANWVCDAFLGPAS